MNRFSKLFAFISLLSILVGTFANVQPAASKPAAKEDKSKRIPDVIILSLQENMTLEDDAGGSGNHKFKTNSTELDEVLSSLGVQSVKPLFPRGQVKKDASYPELERIYQVKLKKNADIDAAIAALSTIADVDYAESDFYIDTTQDPTPTGTPTPPAVNDPRYAEQWALTAIDAPAAWAQMPADAPKVNVAVIDSGICADHPDLQGRILDGWDFVDNDAVPQDDFGHGCSVSGIIAANMDNGIGIAGVAPNAMVMPLRVLDSVGSGSYSNVASAIVYAADHDAKVINLSLGGSNPSTTLESAVNYATSKGVIVVAAAGNNGTEGALYPAAYPDVIAVGSVDSDLQHSSFSNYGLQIDIWAPGRDILTTKKDGSYGLVSGTSFAAPYVAGAEAINNLISPIGLLWMGKQDEISIIETPTDISSETSTPPSDFIINSFPNIKIPKDLEYSLINTLIKNKALLPAGENKFTVSAFRSADNWAEIALVPTYVVEANWEVVNLKFFDIIAHRDESGNWMSYFENSDDFAEIKQIVPQSFIDYSPSVINLADDTKDVYLFPWERDTSWVKTQGWHLNGAIDFAPGTNANSDVLASTSGTLKVACDDGYQIFLRVENTNGNTTYWHLDANSVDRYLIGQFVRRGRKIGSLYAGNQGAGTYDGTYYQYHTDCGYGTGPHLHYIVPSSLTIDGQSIDSVANSANRSSFTSSNTKLDKNAVVVCSDANFKGRCERFTSTDENLMDGNYIGDNSISSYFVPADWGATLWEDPWSMGRGACLPFTPIQYDTGVADLAIAFVWQNCGYGGSDGQRLDNLASAVEITQNPNISCNLDLNAQCMTPPTTGDTTSPTGSWSSPSNGLTITSSNVTLSVNASDNSGGSGVREVRWSAKWGGNWYSIGTDNSSPYSMSWNMCSSGVPNGDVELGFEVWDNANNKWVYSENGHANIHITKNYSCTQTSNDTTPPTVSWTSPGNNSTINSRTVTISANAADTGGSGVKEVHFNALFNGQWKGVNIDTTYPYTFDWDMCNSGVPKGDVELGLEVYDNAGNFYIYSQHYTNYHINFNYDCGGNTGTGDPLAGSPWNTQAWQNKYMAGYTNWEGTMSWGAYPYIYNDWGSGAPFGWGGNEFSMRMWRSVYFPGGYYSFHTDHDDGAKVYLDGNLIIDAWWDGNGGHDSGRNVSAGYHEVKAEYYENQGDAKFTVLWYGPGYPAPDNNPPDGKITSPANLSATSSSALNISADAWDDASGVDRVEFKAWYCYQSVCDWRNLGTDYTAPYTYNWNWGYLPDLHVWLTIHVYDKTGKVKYDPGGWVEVDLDRVNPTAGITSPTVSSYLSTSQITINASASDSGSGIQKVQFFAGYNETTGLEAQGEITPPPPSLSEDAQAESSDVIAQDYWHEIGWDENGSDGWSFNWNSASAPDQGGASFFIYAYDKAGNHQSAQVWPVMLDRTAPSSAVSGLPDFTGGTTFTVSWIGSDSTSGLLNYDIRYQDNEGTWTNWLSATTSTSATFTGVIGHIYTFQSRARDRAGNVEAWPAFADDGTMLVAAPSNDSFGSAITIGSVPYSITTLDTHGATTASTDPTPTCGYGKNSNSVWYKYVAPANGLLEIDTYGSSYDTVLAVWTGTISNLTQIQCNDDLYGYTEAWLENVTVTAGVTYYIEVMDYGNPYGGDLELYVNFASSPANDDFNSPTSISSVPYSNTKDVRGATKASDDPSLTTCNRLPGRNSVWYKYTTPALSGQLDVDTIDSDYDTMLAVWAGTRGNLTLIGCNDDIGDVNGSWDSDSALSVSLQPNTTYYIEASEYNGLIDMNGASATGIQSKPQPESGLGDTTSLQDKKSAIDTGDMSVTAAQGERGGDVGAQLWGGQLQLHVDYHPIPTTPTLVNPSEGTTLSRINNTVLDWNTTGTTCTVHVWGGSIDISPSGSCENLTLGAQRGGAYSWQVTAENAYGSAVGPVWHFNVKPYAPTSLTGAPASATQVNLSWTPSSDEPSDVDSYDIYKNGVLLTNVPKGTTNYQATGLTCNTSYSFYLRAKRQGVQSDNSNTINVTPPCPPTVSMSSTTASLTNVSPIPITVTFSSSVTGFTSDDITVTNGTVGNFAGSGANYTFNLIPAADGLVTASIPAGVAQDSVGNNNLAASQFSRTYDGTAPTASMSSIAPNPTKTSPIAITVTFSESVTGFTASDITTSNGTISNFAGSGANYTFNLTPASNGLVTANIAAGAAQDSAGNHNTASAQFSRAYDTIAPTVSMSSAAATRTNASPIPVTVTFSESVTGFTSSDITVGNGTVSNFAGSGANYTFDLTPASNGVVTANIAASVAQDGAGNNNTAATQFSRTYDTIAPTVVINSTTTNPTNASPIAATATFSESVVGFTASDITANNGTISNFTGSGANYTFSITPLSDGLVTVNIAEDAVQDLAGNNNPAAPQFSRVYDGTAPTVFMNSTTADPTNASPIVVSVEFSENVTGFTASDIAVTNGTVGNFAGSGANYTFNLIPAASGLVTANIAANKAQDAAGNNNTAATQFSRVYDGTAPTISMSSSAADSTNTYPIPVTVTFSESVTGFAEDDIAITNSAISNFAGSGAVYTFDIVPAADGLVTVNIAAGAAQDAVGNNNIVAAQFSRLYDTIAPVTAITGKPASLNNDSTPTFSFQGDDGAGSGAGSYVCKMDDGDYVSCASPFTSPALSDGPHTFYVKAIDRASNEDATPESYAWVLDLILPTVTSINRVGVDAPNLTSIDFVVTFSEPVIGVGVRDFKLTNTLLIDASVTGVSPISDSEYTVTVNTGTGDGTIRLDIPTTAVIADFAGNTVAVPYTGSATYTVQKGAAPTVPVLKLPAANALVTTTPTLDWNDSSEVMALAVNPWSYEINITSLGGYNHTFNTASGLSNSSLSDFSEAPLAPNTTYTWKVRAYNGANQYSAWSLSRTFRTKLATPVLDSPANNATLNTKRPTFTWGSVSGATGYTIQISKLGVPVSTITLTGTTYTPATDLLPNTLYTWRVKANGLNAGDYSAPFTFTTSINPPMPPVLTLPASGAVVDGSVAQKLKWNPVLAVNTTSALTTYPAAASFQVEYALNNTFSDSTLTMVNGNTFAEAELILPAYTLLPNRTYYWRVRSCSGVDAGGNYSAWSLVRTFRTAASAAKLDTPTLVSPADGITLDSKRPTFTWNEVSGATSYTLQVLNGATVAKTVTVTVPQHSSALTADLLPNTIYTWKVKANGLVPSDFSDPFTFKTSLNAPKVPVLTQPLVGGLVDSTSPVTLDWSPVLAVNTTSPTTTYPAAVNYDVEYATNSAFTGSILVNTVTDQYTFPDLLPAHTTYYWRVRSVNATGQVSLWSAARIFKTRVATTTLNLPVSGAVLNNKRPVFEWDAVNGATSYTLQIFKKNATTNLFTVLVHTGTIVAPKYTYTPTVDLLPSTEYAWQVKVNNTIYPGLYSAQSTFTTSVNPPKMPVLSMPATGTIISSATDVTLTWVAPLLVVNANPALAYPSAASYDVQVSTNPQFANFNSNDNAKILNVVGSASTTLFEVLKTGVSPDNAIRPGRTYYWRVRSVSVNGNYSSWSAARMIKVKFTPPLLTSVTNSLTPGKPTFRWNSNDNGLWTSYTITVINATTNAVVKTYTVPAPLTTYTIPASLPRLPAGTYKWKVKINGLYTPIESALSADFTVAP